MNGTEKKTHRSVTADLARGLESIATSAAQRLDAHEVQLARLEKAIHDTYAHHLALAKEQRAYVDDENRGLCRALVALRDRSFWSRLNWLVTGR